jgi:thiamine biosynthesis protein ThiS
VRAGAAFGRSLTTGRATDTLGLLKIRLNGKPYELAEPVSVAALLAHLGIDARRVAVERNIDVVKRTAYETTVIHEGDEIEIVNFVGGG